LPKGTRKIYISAELGMDTVSVFERSELKVGQKINGPCIIEEKESTTVIGPNDSLEVNELGCLIIDLGHTNISSTSDTDTFPLTPDVG
jgi:N-methylhydantoinase A